MKSFVKYTFFLTNISNLETLSLILEKASQKRHLLLSRIIAMAALN